MTIEFSLRRRAAHSRWFAVLWLSLATCILLATCASLPMVANRTLQAIDQIEEHGLSGNSGVPSQDPQAKNLFHVQLFTVGTLTLGVFAVSFACFLLGRTAFVEIELEHDVAVWLMHCALPVMTLLDLRKLQIYSCPVQSIFLFQRSSRLKM